MARTDWALGLILPDLENALLAKDVATIELCWLLYVNCPQGLLTPIMAVPPFGGIPQFYATKWWH
eukprot:15332072-Ditylum_brightwellii.AAC.1